MYQIFRVDKIVAKIPLTKKPQFVTKLMSYWTLKRQSRNGVPLLRRLQSNHMSKKDTVSINIRQWKFH